MPCYFILKFYSMPSIGIAWDDTFRSLFLCKNVCIWHSIYNKCLIGDHHLTVPLLYTTGADSVHNYQQILRQLVYFNRKPAYYLNRAFKLSCSELNGRFSSNDYIQTLTVIHPKVEPQKQLPQTSQKPMLHQNDHIVIQNPSVAHAQVNDHKVEFKDARIKSATGFLEGGGLIDASDAFGRTTASKSWLALIANHCRSEGRCLSL